jgi:hypothetical protein
MRIPLSTLFLILPYLASEAAALPSLRRPRAFKRAGGDASHEWTEHAPYAEEAGATASDSVVASATAVADAPSASASASMASASASASVSVSLDPSFTGIPVASETGNPSDYLPFSETARTLIPLSDVPSSSISSLLAETSKYSTFTFTDYQPAATATETVWATETQAAPSQAQAPQPTENSSGRTADDPNVSNQGLLKQALGGIQGYAESLIGKMMPTVTLEVVLQPTQVCFPHAPLLLPPLGRFADISATRWPLGLCRSDRIGRHCYRSAHLHPIYRSPARLADRQG